MIKRTLQAALPSTLHVVGEISNFKRHAGGHLYFTLKDDACEISCVLWRSDAASLRFKPEDGLEVIATGGVDVFERAGRYQLYVRRLEPRGLGALELAFRQLCEKLRKQGFFEPSRKRTLPRFPRRVALVTSPTGAAIEDMLRTIERRYPCVEVLVFPVRVQGDGAAAEIADAIRSANTLAESLGGIDVLIVGRGGGSLEDLWAFNEEVVARAIYASRIPVVSAVGHEVDVTIADGVADVRAATPTAAAELVVPVLADVLQNLTELTLRLNRGLRARVELAVAKWNALVTRTPFREPATMIHRREQLLDEVFTRAQQGLQRRVNLARRSADRVEPSIARIAPHAFLRRIGLKLSETAHRLDRIIDRRFEGGIRRTDAGIQRLDRPSPRERVAQAAERVDRTGDALAAAMQRRSTSLAERLTASEALLTAVSHKSVLARGFSITRTKKRRAIVRSIKDLTDGQRFVTQLSDGEFESQALNIKQLELFE